MKGIFGGSMNTPVHEAVMIGPEAVNKILDKYPPEQEGFPTRLTPLLLACASGSSKSAILLVSARASLKSRTPTGMTPFLLAVQRKMNEFILFLLSHNDTFGRDFVNDKNYQGYGALHIAVLEENFDMAAFLVGIGFEPEEEAMNGDTPKSLVRSYAMLDVLNKETLV